MGVSRHYTEDRMEREKAIQKIGFGEILYKAVVFDERKGKNFIYEITSTAILVIRAYDEPSLIITKYPARPSRIKRYWTGAPESLIEISIKNTRKGLVF